MKVTRPELTAIMQDGRRTALLPQARNGKAPEGPQRVHRRGGVTVCHVKITDAVLVGPLDETVTAEDARAAGHGSVEQFRDDWVRTHDEAWTGQRAWLVAFTLEPWPDERRLMRGPWDPGVAGAEVMMERRRAPEPEQVDPDRIGWQWGREAGDRHREAGDALAARKRLTKGLR